jgi:hypothetical protein
MRADLREPNSSPPDFVLLRDPPPAGSGPALGPRHGILDAGPEQLPSNFCCLNFGCENPEVCNEIGMPCGWPGTKDDWQRRRPDDLLRLARAQ